MVKSTVKVLVYGLGMRLKETIRYRDGSSTERILHPVTGIPESVTFVNSDGAREEGF